MLKLSYTNKLVEAGIDEAGRGCLAGPVTAAAVILPENFSEPKLNDSKQINELTRYKLREIIEEEAVAFVVCNISNVEIDRLNILNATFMAMNKCILELSVKPELILIDGHRFNNETEINHQCIIKGDSEFQSIAAASILAKTYRDDLMRELHTKHPEYKWEKNKGYPTIEHKKAIVEFGLTAYHRKSFNHGIQLKIFN